MVALRMPPKRVEDDDEEEDDSDEEDDDFDWGFKKPAEGEEEEEEEDDIEDGCASSTLKFRKLYSYNKAIKCNKIYIYFPSSVTIVTV